MSEMINPGNNEQKSIIDCKIPPLLGKLNEDPPMSFCDPTLPNLNDLENGLELGLMDECDTVATGFGHADNCDPMQSGKIRNDPNYPDRSIINRYPRALRGANEAMLDLFTGLEIIGIDSKIIRVPIIWATYERAVGIILQGNVRDDNSLVTDRIKLPMMSIIETGTEFDSRRYCYHQAINLMRGLRPDFKPGVTMNEKMERDTIFGFARGIPINITYELNGWTWYTEEMYQIREAINLKFSPVAYINVRGVWWETIVKLDGQTNNANEEAGDKQRVVKFKFNFTVETYIPQPIVRKKSVLKTTVDFFEMSNEKELTEVIDRLEVAVRELEKDDKNRE